MKLRHVIRGKMQGFGFLTKLRHAIRALAVKKPPVDVLVNGKAEAAGTMTTDKRNDRNTVTVTLDVTRMEDRLAGEERGAVVTVPVSIGTDVAIGELNGRMVKVMEIGDGALELRTDPASYMLPARQINIDAVSAQFGEEVALRDIMVQIEIAEPEEETVRVAESVAADGSFALVAPPVVFTVRAVHGDAVIEMAKFSAYVERTIALPDDADPGRITERITREQAMVAVSRAMALTGRMADIPTADAEQALASFNDAADVSKWARSGVAATIKAGIVSGRDGGRIAPGDTISRAEVAVLARRLLQKSELI